MSDMSGPRFHVSDVRSHKMYNMSSFRCQASNKISQMSRLRCQFHDCKYQIFGLSYELLDVRSQMAGLRRQVSDVRSQLSDARFQVPDARSQMSGLRCQVSDARYGLRCQVPVIQSRLKVPDVRFQMHDMSGPRFHVLNVRSQLQVSDVKSKVRSQMSHITCKVPDVRSQMSGLICQVHDFKYQIFGLRCLMQVQCPRCANSLNSMCLIARHICQVQNVRSQMSGSK